MLPDVVVAVVISFISCTDVRTSLGFTIDRCRSLGIPPAKIDATAHRYTRLRQVIQHKRWSQLDDRRGAIKVLYENTRISVWIEAVLHLKSVCMWTTPVLEHDNRMWITITPVSEHGRRKFYGSEGFLRFARWNFADPAVFRTFAMPNRPDWPDSFYVNAIVCDSVHELHQ